MNAKSKFSIPILSGTRPEVGLFSATVAAPSLRNASNLVSGVPVSSHPIVTTGVISNNAYPIARNTTFKSALDIQDIRYPGTNSLLAYQGAPNQLGYLNSSKKTIQLDYSLNVSGASTSDMMVEYLKTGKLEGDLNAQNPFTTTVLATNTNSNSLTDTSVIASELYDCSPNFNDVSGVEVTAATQGANYQVGPTTARMVYFTDKDGIVGTKATGFVLGTFTSTGAVPNSITTEATTLLDGSIGNIPVDGVLTVEDGQVVLAGLPLISGGSGYPSLTPFAANVKVVSQAPNPSSVSGLPGQGLVLLVGTNVSGEINAVLGINNNGSGYSAGDILEIVDPNGQGSGALVQVQVANVNKNPSINGTLATPKVTSQYRPGSGAPIGPFDSYTVESIKLPNGTIKHLALNSEENICQSKVPKARVFTAGGHKAYYPQISSGLQPTNWNAGNGAALCANPALCLPVGISSQNGQTIVNGVPA